MSAPRGKLLGADVYLPAHEMDMSYITPHIGPARYFGVDLETTGLSDDAHILEISVVILDAQLRVRGSYYSLVATDESVLDSMDPVVLQMHTQSALLDAVRNEKNLPTIEKIERDLLDLLDEHQDPNVPMHFAGGGVAQYDQPHLKRIMPILTDRLHYRPVDFSIIRQAYKDATGVELDVPDYEHPHRAGIDLLHDVQVGRIAYDMMRTAHRANTLTAPVTDAFARVQAEGLLEYTLNTGKVPAVAGVTTDLVEALLSLIRDRSTQPV